MKALLQIHRDSLHGQKLAQATHAKTFMTRLRGLLWHAPLAIDKGMLITPCSQVHTMGMGYALDVVYLDKNGVVVKCVENLKPYRLSAARGAKHTLELTAHSIKKLGLKPGERLVWTEQTIR